MRKPASFLVILLVITGTGLAHAEKATPYLTNKDVDLTMILPPPPANDSAQTKAEIEEVLTLQATRTPEMVERAQADAKAKVWRFADVMGETFTADRLPKTAALFDRIAATQSGIVGPAKEFWKRPRPHLVSDRVKPIVDLSDSGAWPSGHTTLGTLFGIFLGDMVPEKRAAIMARAWEYGQNRVVAGIHYPSDVEMGRIAGSVIAQALMHDPAFQADYEAAKVELRAQ